MDEPLIYTSKGNVPVSSLQYRYQWTDTETDISFVEEYLLAGEVVKRNAHCYIKKGVAAEIEQTIFG